MRQLLSNKSENVESMAYDTMLHNSHYTTPATLLHSHLEKHAYPGRKAIRWAWRVGGKEGRGGSVLAEASIPHALFVDEAAV